MTATKNRKAGHVGIKDMPALGKDLQKINPYTRNLLGKITGVESPMFMDVRSTRSLSTDTMANVSLKVLGEFGWDTKIYKSHALKGSVESTLVGRGIPIDRIAALSGSKSTSCIFKHYVRSQNRDTTCQLTPNKRSGVDEAPPPARRSSPKGREPGPGRPPRKGSFEARGPKVPLIYD